MTWEDFLAFLLTTLAQFYSGKRFYVESYYSIKSRHLGMGFLIAAGTTAAYLYSIFVVLYNAVRVSIFISQHIVDQVLPLFIKFLISYRCISRYIA